MIRFLNLSNQIIDDEPSFAFYDTITDKILSWAGDYVFDSIEEFQESYKVDQYVEDGIVIGMEGIERYLRLIPKDFFTFSIKCSPIRVIKNQEITEEQLEDFKKQMRNANPFLILENDEAETIRELRKENLALKEKIETYERYFEH